MVFSTDSMTSPLTSSYGDPAQIRSALHRNLVFVHGKGGVGKSSVSEAIAWSLAEEGAKVLLIEFEDPTRPPGELRNIGPRIWHLNADASIAFEEYAELKIENLSSGHKLLGGLGALGSMGISKIFTQNKLIKYLAKAAPGIHELVLLGKAWHERNHYDHVIVDLPSTGYGIAMFQSTANFSKLFRGGPIARDAEEMLATFADTRQTGHAILALPEEMPLREAIELNGYLADLFPANRAVFLVNRRFPHSAEAAVDPAEAADSSPYATSVTDYAVKRRKLEAQNLDILNRSSVSYGEIDFLPPDAPGVVKPLTRRISDEMKARGYV